MSGIQQARDVLAKWREAALPGPWVKDFDTDWEGIAQSAITTANGPLTWDDHGGDVFSPGTARLIVGTAGNPDLLDAIDLVLAAEQHSREHTCSWCGAGIKPSPVSRIAAAIIAAENRMNA